ncbi:MAG: hypothetical protein H6Q90_6436 [Deltaproteobacteria bacterium]|nr:hypothetical protein [Deltaproteobacteria bacterium]
MRLSWVGFALCGAFALDLATACGKATHESPTPPPSRVTTNVTRGPDGRFEGTIGTHAFSIVIDGGKLTSADRTAWTWQVGNGRVVLVDAGPIDDQTHFLVARSPRTIMRSSDGLWVVTEVVTTAGGRVFTCLHQQTVAKDGTAEAREARAIGVAACGSLRVTE